MPKGPKGEWRPVGANESAAPVCRIATAESPELYKPPAAERKRARADAAARMTRWRSRPSCWRPSS